MHKLIKNMLFLLTWVGIGIVGASGDLFNLGPMGRNNVSRLFSRHPWVGITFVGVHGSE